MIMGGAFSVKRGGDGASKAYKVFKLDMLGLRPVLDKVSLDDLSVSCLSALTFLPFSSHCPENEHTS